jgi:hypothetical protein
MLKDLAAQYEVVSRKIGTLLIEVKKLIAGVIDPECRRVELNASRGKRDDLRFLKAVDASSNDGNLEWGRQLSLVNLP